MINIKNFNTFKLYESKSEFIEISDRLSVYIPIDKNIKFYIREHRNENYLKYHIATGIAIMLSPKSFLSGYLNDNKLKNINITRNKNIVNILSVTNYAMLKYFLHDFEKYDHYTIMKRSRILKKIFYFEINDKPKTIGEYIDKVKKFKKNVIKYEKPYYEKYLIEKEMKKFNL